MDAFHIVTLHIVIHHNAYDEDVEISLSNKRVS